MMKAAAAAACAGLLGTAAGMTTCADMKAIYNANQCCGMPSKTVSGLPTGWTPAEGPLNSVFPSTDGVPKLIMAVDIDYPPYAYINTAPFNSRDALDSVVGVGKDMIEAMGQHCGFEVEVVQAHWSDCWGSGEIGQGLLEGWYHGCMTYTHATAVRNRYLEFSDSWAILNKPSGLITKLTNGVPHVNGMDTLSGRVVVDVTGWAPTADTLYFVVNQCTQQPYTNFTIIQGDDVTNLTGTPLGPNDRALLAVLEGHADAMWIYGDQASNYHCEPGMTQSGWDCDLWAGFGTTFAYAQSGMFGWMHNGTTVSISKKGSGISKLLDACLASFQPTQAFYDVCNTMHAGHNQLSTCIPNDFIRADPAYTPADEHHNPYMFGTSQLAGHQNCSTGYCTCSEGM